MVDSWKNNPRYQNVDDAIQKWRQGDCVLGEQWFVHLFDPELPLTEASAAVAGEDVNIAESAVKCFINPCHLVRLATALGVSLDEIAGRNGQEAPHG